MGSTRNWGSEHQRVEAQTCFSFLTQNAHSPHFGLFLTLAWVKGAQVPKQPGTSTVWKEFWLAVADARGSPPSAGSLPRCPQAHLAAATALVLTAANLQPSSPQLQTSISLPPGSPSARPMVPQTWHPFQTQALILFPENIILDKFTGPRKQAFTGTCGKAQRDCTDF